MSGERGGQGIGPSLPIHLTGNMNTYLDMLELYAVPQIKHLQPHIILQQDGAPPHWGLQVRAYLDRTFPGLDDLYQECDLGYSSGLCGHTVYNTYMIHCVSLSTCK
ncbi:hypothetical protein L798_10999 [Zootermopsis nevadensis]|uniref:Uncharacterized protein n=1 Tax=Zootermopsis nevadensis TaxID=136037 RepID=A0A067R6S7_ZOONE|nr:hypothetical protein L798_10999 [Zootermopsis nevadensis]